MKKFSHPFMHLLVLAAWSLVMMVVSVILGMVLGIADSADFRTPTAGFLLWNVIVQLFTFALPVVLVTMAYYRENQRGYYRMDFGRCRWMLALAGVAVLLLLVPIIDWLSIWNDGWHWSGAWEPLERSLREAGEQSQQMVEGFMKECYPLLNLFALALIPALCEELFFRAGIQNLLQRWFSSRHPGEESGVGLHAAVWVTAALFSLAHGEVFAFLPRFLLGALLGYLYVYGRSLLVNVVVHFVNNAVIVVAYALMSGDGSQFDPSAPLATAPVLTFVCTLAALALFWFVFLRRPDRSGC